MPSKDELCVLEETNNRTIIAHDVEQLVSELKENLRLSTVSLKARPSYGRQSRPSPYRVPCRSWSEPAVCDNCIKFNRNSSNCQHCTIRHKNTFTSQQTQETSDDPYEMLQALIKSQSLIKEAVRRLQFGLASTSTTSTKKYLYDSDDECRTPPANATVLQQICGVEIV